MPFFGNILPDPPWLVPSYNPKSSRGGTMLAVALSLSGGRVQSNRHLLPAAVAGQARGLPGPHNMCGYRPITRSTRPRTKRRHCSDIIQRGIEIVRTYADEGKSGLRLDGRDALKRLIDDVHSGRTDFTTILVYDVNRWFGVSTISQVSLPISPARKPALTDSSTIS
jgi:hypothetical protein